MPSLCVAFQVFPDPPSHVITTWANNNEPISATKTCTVSFLLIKFIVGKSQEEASGIFYWDLADWEWKKVLFLFRKNANKCTQNAKAETV